MMETLTKLNLELERTLAIARTRFPTHSFPEPEIKMDLTGKTAGMFCPMENKLRFNLSLMLENKEDFIEETVPHEVAHFVTNIIDKYSKPHGSTWQAIMKLFGILNPQTCHSYKIAPLKPHKRPYIYQCTCKKHFFTKIRHNRAQKGVQYFCTTCHQDLSYIGKEK